MLNLLSWRKDLRKQKRRLFWQMLLISILVVVVIVFIWAMMLVYEVKKEMDNDIKQQLVALNSKDIKAKKIQQQEKQLVKQTKDLRILHNKSQQVIRLFKELSTIVPQQVHLTELDKKDNEITLIGEAQLDIGIVEFMENVKQSKLLNNPELQKVNSHNANNEGFILKCLLD